VAREIKLRISRRSAVLSLVILRFCLSGKSENQPSPWINFQISRLSLSSPPSFKIVANKKQRRNSHSNWEWSKDRREEISKVNEVS